MVFLACHGLLFHNQIREELPTNSPSITASADNSQKTSANLLCLIDLLAQCNVLALKPLFQTHDFLEPGPGWSPGGS